MNPYDLFIGIHYPGARSAAFHLKPLVQTWGIGMSYDFSTLWPGNSAVWAVERNTRSAGVPVLRLGS